MARFEQVRPAHGYPADLGADGVARAADNIIAARRVSRVTAALGAKADLAEEGEAGSERIAADYGRSLDGPLAYITRHSMLFDAALLPHEKSVISSALMDCANRDWITEEEQTVLGDLHFYLSFFVAGLEGREGEPDSELAAEQQAEGLALRSEWQQVLSSRKRAGFARFLPTWLVQ